MLLALGAWLLTQLARRWNRQDAARWFYVGLAAAIVLSLASAAALLAGPWLTQLDPTLDVYPATVWLLSLWAAAHCVLGVLMHGYCLARRWAGRMTAQYDIDINNVALYWHFCAITVVVTVATIAGFPLVA
jgi:cytochrome c oxidase subunit I+III